MKQKILIIGAGYGGLSAAALLSKDGYDVTVIEKNDQPGGRAMLYETNGYKFDMGPSWYLMPDIFEKFYQQLGKNINKELKLIRLDPAYRIYFGPKDSVDISPNMKKNLALFESIEPGSSKQFKKYLEKSKYQYDVSIKHFLYKPYFNVTDFFNKKIMIEGPKLKLFQSLDSYMSTYFKSDKLKKILEYTMVFLGGSPKNTPALYSLMSHVDFNLGVWYPKGGMNAVARSIHKIAEENGAKFIFGEEVKKINVTNKKAVSLTTNKKTYHADKIIVNADYAHAELNLLEQKHQTYNKKYWETRTIAPSGYIMYLGLKKKIPGLKHHTLVLDHDWIRHFNDIFEKPSWPENPSYYVCCPSKTEKEMAPKGKENIFVLVPVAPGLKDTDEIRNQYYDKILAHLETTLGTKIKEHVEVKRIFTHRDFSKTFNAYKGTALGLTHSLLQTAIFRPKHKSKKVKNLYYTGQYTNPGVGVPMTIISSQILREVIKKEK
jgi:phytoene desaturase